MSEAKQSQATAVGVPDPRWKDLYRIGSIACIAFPVLIIAFIVAYFVWPYTPGLTSVVDIFDTLQDNRLEGLISLDLAVPVMLPLLVLQMLALYVALKRVNESYALIALVFGLTGVVLWLAVRPLAEMVYLSGQYATATTGGAKSQYLAAGEALSALFNGTAWMFSQILIPISYTISSLLMLQSSVFSRVEAYVGIVFKPLGMGILLPGIGATIGILGTLGGVVWYLLLSRTFFKLGWRKTK